MKINGKTITPNELAKLEILEQIEAIYCNGIDDSHTACFVDNITDREENAILEQAFKRGESIRKLLGAEKLYKKFGLKGY